VAICQTSKELKATEWLLEVMARPEHADDRPVFLIHHPDLITGLKLQDKGVENSGLRYYTFNDIRPVVQEIIEQGRKASESNRKCRRPIRSRSSSWPTRCSSTIA